LFASCAKEEEGAGHLVIDHTAKITITNLEQLLNDSKFTTALARVPTRTGISAEISGRSALEEQFQFTIIGSEDKVTKEDGK